MDAKGTSMRQPRENIIKPLVLCCCKEAVEPHREASGATANGAHGVDDVLLYQGCPQVRGVGGSVGVTVGWWRVGIAALDMLLSWLENSLAGPSVHQLFRFQRVGH